MPRAGLTRAALVQAAIDVVDDDGVRGWDSLTLAAVAGRVGVAVPSLYKHVSSLADLRCSIALRCVNELARELMTATVGRSGSDALVALASAYRDYALQHPARYLATQVGHTDPARQHCRDGRALADASGGVVAVVAAVLTGCGVARERLVDSIRAVRAALHGFVSLEVSGGFAMPQDVDESFTFLVRSLDAGVRAAGVPVSSAGSRERASQQAARPR